MHNIINTNRSENIAPWVSMGIVLFTDSYSVFPSSISGVRTVCWVDRRSLLSCAGLIGCATELSGCAMFFGLFIFSLVNFVEGQHYSDVCQSQYEEFYPDRQYSAVPSSTEIAEEEKPQQALYAYTKRTPGFGTEFLIPDTPEGEGEAYRVTKREIGGELRKYQ